MSPYVAMIDENIGRCHLSLEELDHAAGVFRNTAETTEVDEREMALLGRHAHWEAHLAATADPADETMAEKAGR